MPRRVARPLPARDNEGGRRMHWDERGIALLLRGLLGRRRFLNVRFYEQSDIRRKRDIKIARSHFEMRPFGRQEVYADVLIALDRKTFSRHMAIVGGMWLPGTNEHILVYFITQYAKVRSSYNRSGLSERTTEARLKPIEAAENMNDPNRKHPRKPGIIRAGGMIRDDRQAPGKRTPFGGIP